MLRNKDKTLPPPNLTPYVLDLESLAEESARLNLPPLPRTQKQLLAMARGRLPALRAELEFWQMVLTRAQHSEPGAAKRPAPHLPGSAARLLK